MSQISEINQLLDDKLYQVIGSTPASIAESLKKLDLRGKAREGSQIFAIALFAAAVNKATLETFLSDSRFSDARPLITAALSISGKANMTALTLLGHCLLMTDAAGEVHFASEFRKKMGQNHLWAGDLENGSLSDLQKKILKEKKRVTAEREASALGNGFLKICGLARGALEGLETDYFGTGNNPSVVAGQASTGTSQLPSGSVRSGMNRDSLKQMSTSSVPASAAPTAPITILRSENDTLVDSPPRASRQDNQRAPTQPRLETITAANSTSYQIPEDVLSYRRNMLGMSDADILESVEARGLENFVNRTRVQMERDPTGEKTVGAQSRAG